MAFNDIMLDFETASTASNGVILSVGGARFSLDGGLHDDGFYASISLESNMELGRVVDEDTLKWWMKQSPEAQRVWHEPKQHIATVFSELRHWIVGDDEHEFNPDVRVWSNGADFDIPMAASVYRQLGMQLPWHYWNNRCFRTFKSLPGAEKVPRPNLGVKHNALDDAIAQVKHAQAIYECLFMKSKVAA